jgi:hypothetical protein
MHRVSPLSIAVKRSNVAVSKGETLVDWWTLIARRVLRGETGSAGARTGRTESQNRTFAILWTT